MRARLTGPRFLPPLPVLYTSLLVLDGLCLMLFIVSPLSLQVTLGPIFVGLLILDAIVYTERTWAFYARAIAAFVVGWLGTVHGFGWQPPPNATVIAGAPQFVVCGVLFVLIVWRSLHGDQKVPGQD